MKKYLLATILAAVSTAAFSESEAQKQAPSQRETFERECDTGVTLGIYALAHLEMIEVDKLLEKKQAIAPLCKTLTDEEIAPLFAVEDAELRIRYGGGLLAVQGMKIDEQGPESKFSKALVYLIRNRGYCECDKVEEDLESYESRVKNPAPKTSKVDPEAIAREHTVRIREYAFVDACERGKEIGNSVLGGKTWATQEERKRFNQECAGIYARPDVRKTLDPMDDVGDLHRKGCAMGAEAVYGEKGVRPDPQQALSQAFHCQSISYSERLRAEDQAMRTETTRGRIRAKEDAFWVQLGAEG